MMETGTFLNEETAGVIAKNFIPLKYQSGRDSEQFLRFNIRGTPSYIILNANGDEEYRTTGFYGPADFIKQLERSKQNP